jgi:uncharacterized membrane protein
MWDVLNFIGLSINFVGAIVLTIGMIVTKKGALKVGVSRLGSVNEEDNLRLPAVKDRIKQSKIAICGVIFLIVGFCAQAVCALQRLL